MEKRRLAQGKERPHTLSSMANLVTTWKSQGYIEQATDLVSECGLF